MQIQSTIAPGRGLKPHTNLVGLPSRQVRHRQASIVSRASTDKQEVESKTDESEESIDFDALLETVQNKWEAIEDKQSIAVYGGGAAFIVYVSSVIVGAVNQLPLIPKVLEFTGFVYTCYFVYNYLLFKSSREKLVQTVNELKAKISGQTK